MRLDSSKADVYNAGEVRDYWRSGDSDLCVLEALEEVVSSKTVTLCPAVSASRNAGQTIRISHEVLRRRSFFSADARRT